MLEGVTIDQLRTLRAVAEEGSFSAAARRLGQGQPAVSQAMSRLEEQLGLELFDRHGRTPELTAAGEAVVAAAARIHDDLSAFDAVVKRLKSGVETKLSIAVDAMFPTDALIAFIRELAAAHPALELTVQTEMLAAVTALVRDRRATLGIAGTDVDLEGLEQRHLANLRMIAVAAPSHPLTRIEGVVSNEALSDAVQIVLTERTQPSKRGTADRGVLSARTWRVADLMTKHALLVAGLGWGNQPEHLLREDLAKGRLVALDLAAWEGASPQRSLALVRRKSAPLGPIATWAADRLTSLCQAALHPSPVSPA